MPPVPVTISWSPTDGLSCTDCLDPEVVPPGTTTYTITIEDAVGCRAQDQVTVEANIIRPVYAPNVFTPDNDGINDHFYLGFGPQAEFVEEICIFDRWGNLVYTGAGNPNDPTLGWDGNYDNTPVNPGVFAWLARVRFIDGEVLNYSGDITVLR